MTVRHVILVGLMGSGKTTVGRALAERLHWPLVDSDDAVRERSGRMVRELWEQGGEQAYRHLESEALIEAALDESPSVIAAAAGTIVDPVARQAPAAEGNVVVWLRASPSVLAARAAAGGHRPLLGENAEEVLARQAAVRNDLYAWAADLVVDVERARPDDAVTAILAGLGAVSPGR